MCISLCKHSIRFLHAHIRQTKQTCQAKGCDERSSCAFLSPSSILTPCLVKLKGFGLAHSPRVGWNGKPAHTHTLLFPLHALLPSLSFGQSECPHLSQSNQHQIITDCSNATKMVVWFGLAFANSKERKWVFFFEKWVLEKFECGRTPRQVPNVIPVVQSTCVCGDEIRNLKPGNGVVGAEVMMPLNALPLILPLFSEAA